MSNYYASTFGWGFPGLSGAGIVIEAGSQGCTVHKLELVVQPGTVNTGIYISLSRGGTAATGSTLATCPLRDNTLAMSKVLFQPTGGTGDPNLPAGANDELAQWDFSEVGGTYGVDFPGGGIWVPPESALYMNASGDDGAFYYNMYFSE